MKALLRGAFRTQRQKFRLMFSLLMMCFLTFASQLEVFAIGVMTNKGPIFSGFIGKVITLFEKIFPIREDFRALALFLVTVALLKALTLFAYRFSTKALTIRVSTYLRQLYFEHIQTLSLEFYQKHHTGALSSRVVMDATIISEAWNAALTNYVHTPFTIITTVILCFFTSFPLSLIVFFGLPIVVFPIAWIAKRVKRVAMEIQHNQEQFSSVLLDFLGGIQTVKAFSMEYFSLEKYREQNERMAFLEKKSAKYDLASRPIIHMMGMFFLAFTLLFGLYGLKMSVPDTIFFAGLLYVFYEPIKKFAEENGRIQKGFAAAQRMFEVISLQPSIRDQKDAIIFHDFRKMITFSHVSFSYEEGRAALYDLSFVIQKGESVAIVGPTGGGKSTIATLLLRFYDPKKGFIEIDDHPLTEYNLTSLRKHIAFVPQKPFFFRDTIEQNIVCGRSCTAAELEEAVRLSHADEFIDRLPLGIKTPLEEGGKNLSGGQQQRLVIARALLKRAPILIMDEATSALDYVSEELIRETLNQLRGSVTQIIIAHRLSTIEGTHKILYLERGKRVAFDTKEALLANCPQFLRMWQKGALSA